jgi:hypothetical protein
MSVTLCAHGVGQPHVDASGAKIAASIAVEGQGLRGLYWKTLAR